MVGVVTDVMLSKGFAFIRGSDNLSRFVYCRDVVPTGAFDTLHEGQKVEFTPAGELNKTPGARNNGLRALEVTPCS